MAGFSRARGGTSALGHPATTKRSEGAVSAAAAVSLEDNDRTSRRTTRRSPPHGTGEPEVTARLLVGVRRTSPASSPRCPASCSARERTSSPRSSTRRTRGRQLLPADGVLAREPRGAPRRASSGALLRRSPAPFGMDWKIRAPGAPAARRDPRLEVRPLPRRPPVALAQGRPERRPHAGHLQPPRPRARGRGARPARSTTSGRARRQGRGRGADARSCSPARPTS